MTVDKETTEVAIIGAGPGGYAAAFRAADLGLKVTLIDVESKPGGVCLYKGCIPSKALLHAAKVVSESRNAKNWGIHFKTPEIDMVALEAWKDGVVRKLTDGLGNLAGRRKIHYIQGLASFVDRQRLLVDRIHGGQLHLTFDKAVVATGSRPMALFEGPVAESPNLLTSTGALALKEVPRTLLVIGAGYIGLELGTVFATLGSEVTVAEMTDEVMPGLDRDLVAPLEKRVRELFKSIHLHTTAQKVEETKSGLKVFLKGHGKGEWCEFDKILMAAGRRPNTSGLGLNVTGIQVDEGGFIRVDDRRATDDPNIYAIGDVTGEPLLAHKATHEGLVAAECIAGKTAFFQPQAIPAVVFTDPEIAWCGLTEGAAKRGNMHYRVASFPWAASGRALTLDRPDGVTKLIIDGETERILGVGITGSGAGELIGEGVVAIEMGATVSDLKLCIHPHPTLSETVMEAAEVFFGQSVHLYRPRREIKES